VSKILAGNWKMFKNRAETRAFFAAVGSSIKNSGVRKIVAVSPTLLETALAAAAGTGIEVFAQNVAGAESGAFTGETSPLQLLDLGVTGTLIAHSERRQYFNETDKTAVAKAKLALSKGLQVIYCIGETLEERQGNRTEAVLTAQMAPVIAEVLPLLEQDLSVKARFMIAYEPVWAIGTGLVASPAQVADAHKFIDGLLAKAGKRFPLLYGGSVKPDNFGELASTPAVAGGLVGGASLTADSYLALHAILDKLPSPRV
jgi:triosephosphate isomerase